MSDLDVSLRLKLVNQLSRPAEEAERDLKELKAAAEKLGKASGGDQLTRDLDRLGQKAGAAKGKLDEMERTARQLGRGGNGLEALARDADKTAQAIGQIKGKADVAEQGIKGIGTAAQGARQKIELLDDAPALRKVKTDADAAAKAVREIGTAADAADRKLDGIRRDAAGGGPWGSGGPSPSVVIPPPGSPERRRLGRDAATGLADRAGIDAFVPIGAGVGYAAGAGVGAGVLAVGQGYKRFAGNDRETEYILMNMGVPEAEGDTRRRQVRDIARETRAPYAKVQEGLNALAATGLPVEEVMTMLPSVSRTALAANAEPADVARSAFAIRDKMGIKPENMQQALDTLVAGGNLGQFEVPDMAQYLPSVLAYGSQAGLSGIEGLRKVIAMLQATRADTGESSQAAVNLQNVFAKMRSEETEKNFKDYGVDLPAEFKAGRKAGKDDVEILYEAAMKASKGGDTDILARLFVDQQAFLGLQSLVKKKDKIRADEEELAGSGGAVDQQWSRVSHDAQSSIDALSNGFDRFMVSVGQLADQLGLSKVLDYTGSGLDKGSDSPGKALETVVTGGSPYYFIKKAIESALPSDLSRPIGDLKWPEQDGPARTKGGVSDARPMPTSREAAAITGKVESELSADMSNAAAQSMEGYNAELVAQGEKAVAIVQSYVQQLRSMLSFTASPVISPVINAPSGSIGAPSGSIGAPAGKQSSADPAGAKPVKLTQNITSPNSRLAARAAVREQNRSIRMAQAGALHDLGSRV